MFWLIIALSAYLGLAAVAVIDKYLLAGPIKSPAVYAATIGLLSVFAFLILPFSPFVPTLSQLALDISAGAFFIFALLAYFTALKKGEASRVVPLSAACVPLFTLILANIFIGESLTGNQLLGFGILVLGGVVITFAGGGKNTLGKKELHKIYALAVLASFLFAVHFILMKQVYFGQPFVGGLIWSALGKIVGAVILLTVLKHYGRLPKLKFKVKHAKNKSFSFFVLARVLGGLSGIAQNYAIFLASVSLVNALQGFQHAFLFLLIYILGKKVTTLKEDFNPRQLLQKVSAVIILSFGIAMIYSPSDSPKNAPTKYGVTFSHTFATDSLGIDWQKAYDDMLEELNVKILRLPVYWSEVQPLKNEWNLDVIEYQLQKATEKKIDVILVVGRKQPRWPECHVPVWAQSLAEADQQAAIINYIEEIVHLYSDHPAVVAWQVENEPLFPFGLCPEPSEKFLAKEIEAVRNISSKLIVITDSGELSTWLPEAKMGDILGTTMYRQVFHEKFGMVDYHLPPAFFIVKSYVAKALSARPALKIINVELQGEPWGPKQIN